MAALGDDCFFYCTATCAKGAACLFRHDETAKTARTICQHWQVGMCFRPMCGFRHSDFPLQSAGNMSLGKSEVMCFWESQPMGCTKVNCTFKHVNPRPTGAGTVVTASSTSVMSTDSTVPSQANCSQFAVPQVNPVIIHPMAESEDSNASPAKRPNVPSTQPQIPKLNLEESMKETEIITDKNRGIEKLDSKEIQSTTSTNTAEETKPKIKKKVMKKVVKKVAGTKAIVKKSPGSVKKKIVKKTLPTAALAESALRLSAKDRLGLGVNKSSSKPAPKVEQSESGSSDSDSDDSIENVKVKSMEEIFRQKALESMMKRRAAVGKELLPFDSSKKRKENNIIKLNNNRPTKSAVQQHSNQVKVVRRVRAASVQESAGEEEGEASSSSEESSDVSSTSDSSDDSSEEESEEDFEPDVRRVVVDEDSEVAARKRAKAALLLAKKKFAAEKALHKTLIGRASKPTKKAQLKAIKELAAVRGKKRVIQMDTEALLTASKRQNIQDRLGGSKRNVVAVSRISSQVTMNQKSNALSQKGDYVDFDHQSSEESDNLSDVKIKSWEEIRHEKLKRLGGSDTDSNSSPAKHRPSPTMTDQEVEVVRQIVVTDEQKKPKRRPWRSKQPGSCSPVGGQAGEDNQEEPTRCVVKEGDERIVSPSGSPSKGKQEVINININPAESPFAQLKRKALMRKLESQKMRLGALLGDDEELEKELQFEAEEEIADRPPAKAHKHKHKHKHKKEHKRSKGERQIYMPPGLKNSVALLPTPITSPPLHEAPSDQREADPSQAREGRRGQGHSDQREADPSLASPLAREGRRRQGHKMAAAWTAGLAVSSKGNTNRPEPVSGIDSFTSADDHTPLPSMSISARQRLGLGNREEKREESSAPSMSISARQRLGLGNREEKREESSAPRIPPTNSWDVKSSSSSGPIAIKSFTEIMAEKKRKRLEMMAAKGGRAPIKEPTTTNPAIQPISLFGKPSQPTPLFGKPAPPSISPLRSSVSANDAAKSRVPISPIVFGKAPALNPVAPFSSVTPQRNSQVPAKPKVTVPPPNPLPVPIPATIPTPSSTPIELSSTNSSGQNRKTVLSAKKTKKLFKKKTSIEKKDDFDRTLETIDSVLELDDSSMSFSLDLSNDSMSIPPASPSPQKKRPIVPKKRPIVPKKRSIVPKIINSAISKKLVPEPSIHKPVEPIHNNTGRDVSTMHQHTSVLCQSQLTPNSQPAKTHTHVPGRHTEPSPVAASIKHKSPILDAEIPTKKSRLSMDDEFAGLLDDDDIAHVGNMNNADEDIDDLLADIDDLLA